MKVIPFQSTIERLFRGRKLRKEQAKIGDAIRILRGLVK